MVSQGTTKPLHRNDSSESVASRHITTEEPTTQTHEPPPQEMCTHLPRTTLSITVLGFGGSLQTNTSMTFCTNNKGLRCRTTHLFDIGVMPKWKVHDGIALGHLIRIPSLHLGPSEPSLNPHRSCCNTSTNFNQLSDPQPSSVDQSKTLFTPLKSAISEPTQGSSDKSCKQSLHPTKHQAASLLVAICSRRKAQPQLSPTSDTKNAHIKDKHLGSLHWDEDLGACYPSQCDRPTQTAPL